MKTKRFFESIIFRIVIVTIFAVILFVSLITNSFTLSEKDAWDISRKHIAEIEQKKADEIIADQSMSVNEQNLLLQKEKNKQNKELEKAKKAAKIRYEDILASIENINQKSINSQLTEVETIELINLEDEAFDLAQRYEMFKTITPEEKLLSVINTLRSEGDVLPNYYDTLKSTKSATIMQSINRQIFLAESYMDLADDVQKKWNDGADIDFLNDYIDIQREDIVAKSELIK